MVTERDLREYRGYLDRYQDQRGHGRTSIDRSVVVTLEEAAQIMLKRQSRRLASCATDGVGIIMAHRCATRIARGHGRSARRQHTDRFRRSRAKTRSRPSHAYRRTPRRKGSGHRHLSAQVWRQLDLLSAVVADTPDKIASTLCVVSMYSGSIGLAVIPPNSHCRNITRAAESRFLPDTLE